MPPLDFSQPHPIDQAAAAQHLTSTVPDCSFAREVQTQVSASMAQPMPGAESLIGAGGMPVVPGAEQAISPLIQMIMRMPGHIGMAASFFECLSNFFLPQTDMLSIFDPSNFGLHIDLSSALPADHTSIDFSLLPHDAPILDHLGSVDMGSAHGLDLASDKLNLSLGGHSHLASDGSSTSMSMGSQLNVSGQASFARPQFEGAGGLISGPNVSENFTSNSLSSNDRLFSDGESISSASRNTMFGGGSPAGQALNSPALAQGASAGSLSNGANLNSTTLAAGGTNSSLIPYNVSAHASSANNVSYNVFEKLTGNKEILAANNVSDSYHSTVGTIQPDAPGPSVNNAAASHAPTGHADTGSSHSHATTSSDNPGGLKAKPMSLDGAKVELKADHAKFDNGNVAHPDHKVEHAAQVQPEHKGDHTAEAKADHKLDHKADQKLDHTAQAKPEHKVEAKPEHKPDHKTDSQLSDASKAHKSVDQVSHSTVKPAVHTSAPVHTAAPVQTSGHNIEGKQIAAVAKHVPSAGLDSAHAAVGHDQMQQAGGQNPQVQNQFENMDGAQGQNEAAQSASSAETQQQFGDPIKSAPAGDASAQAGDATQAHDANGQTLEQQHAPATAKAYTIRSGDCLWNIAKDQLGDATKWSDIYKMNNDVLGSNPSLIHPGTSIQLPGAETAASGNIAHYTVKAGDNLWDIAKAQMGDATKWGDLYKANQDVIGANPSLIRPGQELTFTTGGPDPAGAQLSSTGTPTSGNLAQAPAPAGAAPMQQGAGEMGTVSENSAPINTYGDGQMGDMQGAQVQNSSDMSYQAAPINHNIQAPQAPQGVTPAKVMPVEAQPDAILQPAHAADMTTGLSPEAANVANGVAQAQKGGVVNTNVGSDLMSFLNKRR